MSLLIWISLLCWSWCVSARVIIISEKGTDLQTCLKSQVPCQSLVKVSKYSHKLNNVIIMINDTNYTLPIIIYNILMPSTLFGLNKTNIRFVPLLDGELDYPKGAHHLWYAVSAIVYYLYLDSSTNYPHFGTYTH